jgi:hypothetical protein
MTGAKQSIEKCQGKSRRDAEKIQVTKLEHRT